MNNNPIGWPDSAFGYNSSTQTLTAPTVAATKAITATVPASFAGGDIITAAISGVGTVVKSGRVGSNAYVGTYSINATYSGFYSNASSGIVYTFTELGTGGDPSGRAIAAFALAGGPGSFYVGSGATIGWASGSVASTSPDTFLRRDAANTLAQYNSTNAQTLRVYNTYTSATNYERGKLEWSGNVFNVGTEKGSGGGTARSMALQTDATDRLTLDTVGSVRVTTGLTVATLPASPTVGMIARVTNALLPTIGSTVAGGGAANALCWYNGTNWTVLGI